MCMVQEIGARAQEYAKSLLTAGCINIEQYQGVMEQLKEQMALCATALMAEVRLRTNAILNERAAMEQIGRELMTFIASREQEKRRRRRSAAVAFGKIREMQPPEYQGMRVEETASYGVSVGNGRRLFMFRYPDIAVDQAEKLAGFSH